jgi:hypothetical protein
MLRLACWMLEAARGLFPFLEVFFYLVSPGCGVEPPHLLDVAPIEIPDMNKNKSPNVMAVGLFNYVFVLSDPNS